jgi:hypothetical protein
VLKTTGLKNNFQVREYFRKRAVGEVEPDLSKDSNAEGEWITMIEMYKRVHRLLLDEMVKNDDGSYRLVLKNKAYKSNARFYEGLVKRWCPGKKVKVYDAFTL